MWGTGEVADGKEARRRGLTGRGEEENSGGRVEVRREEEDRGMQDGRIMNGG